MRKLLFVPIFLITFSSLNFAQESNTKKEEQQRSDGLVFEFPVGKAKMTILSDMRTQLKNKSFKIFTKTRLADFVTIEEVQDGLNIYIRALGKTSKIALSFLPENNRYIMKLLKQDLPLFHRKFKRDFIRIVTETLEASQGKRKVTSP